MNSPPFAPQPATGGPRPVTAHLIAIACLALGTASQFYAYFALAFTGSPSPRAALIIAFAYLALFLLYTTAGWLLLRRPEASRIAAATSFLGCLPFLYLAYLILF